MPRVSSLLVPVAESGFEVGVQRDGGVRASEDQPRQLQLIAEIVAVGCVRAAHRVGFALPDDDNTGELAQ